MNTDDRDLASAGGIPRRACPGRAAPGRQARQHPAGRRWQGDPHRLRDRHPGGDPSLTRTGTFLGSPGYIAPERLREEPAGPESDLWSLAAALYTAVEGRPPFERDAPMAMLAAVLTEDVPPPSRAGSLAPLLWHLLRKAPADRLPAGPTEDVLRRVAAGGPSGLTVPAPPPPARRARHRSLVITTVAAAVLAVTGTASALVLWPDGSSPRPAARTTAPAPVAPITPHVPRRRRPGGLRAAAGTRSPVRRDARPGPAVP